MNETVFVVLAEFIPGLAQVDRIYAKEMDANDRRDDLERAGYGATVEEFDVMEGAA